VEYAACSISKNARNSAISKAYSFFSSNFSLLCT
jgi:hypothetical protein